MNTHCCDQHTSHDVRWIEHPVYGSCGEGHFVVVACCEQCSVAGKIARPQKIEPNEKPLSRDDWHEIMTTEVPYPTGAPDQLVRAIAQVRITLGHMITALPDSLRNDDEFAVMAPWGAMTGQLREVGKLLAARVR